MNVFPRILVLFLLLVNVAFLYMHMVNKPEAARQAVTGPAAGMKRLVLLSEREAGTPRDAPASQDEAQPQPQAADAASEPVVDDAAGGESQAVAGKPAPPQPQDNLQACYTLGPLPDEARARAHAETLGGEGYQVDLRSSPAQVQRGYWVLLPPFLSNASANKALGQLKSDGFSDVALLTSGEFENSISVGLFTNRETALGRQKKLLEKNYQTVIRERLVTRTNYWLDITGPQQVLASRLQGLTDSGEKLGIASCRSGQISGRE
jgi:hypothetical protein